MNATTTSRTAASCGALFAIVLFVAAGDGSESYLAPRAVAGLAALALFIPFLAYVQITDARSLDDPTPCLPGTGALPLREARDELVRCGYDGWVSLEWASYWYPDAPPLDAALPCALHWHDGSLWGDGG